MHFTDNLIFDFLWKLATHLFFFLSIIFSDFCLILWGTDQIVEMCIEAGLVWGKELYFDGTKVQANADFNNMIPRWYWQATQHLQSLFPDDELPSPATLASRLVEKYDGTRLTGRRTKTYQRVTDTKVSPVDPEASPMKKPNGDGAKLGYHTHYVVDGGKSRIILAALVTPASIMDNTPMLDLEWWVRLLWKVKPDIVVGDAKYGTVVNLAGLEQDGIRAYIPVPDHSKRTRFYPREMFCYDAERDLFICPQGNEIPLYKVSYSEEEWVYRPQAEVCNNCPVKSECTNSKSGRHIRRSFFQDTLDRAATFRETEAFKKALRKRQVWVEPLFGEGKQWHQMRKFRLRGLHKVNIQGLLIAAGQNIKRLLTFKKPSHRFAPIGSVAALPLPPRALVSAVFST